MESATKSNKRRGWGKGKRKNKGSVANPQPVITASEQCEEKGVEEEEEEVLLNLVHTNKSEGHSQLREPPSLPITPHRVFSSFNDSIDLGTFDDIRDILPGDHGHIDIPHLRFGIACGEEESDFIHDMKGNSYYDSDANPAAESLLHDAFAHRKEVGSAHAPVRFMHSDDIVDYPFQATTTKELFDSECASNSANGSFAATAVAVTASDQHEEKGRTKKQKNKQKNGMITNDNSYASNQKDIVVSEPTPVSSVSVNETILLDVAIAVEDSTKVAYVQRDTANFTAAWTSNEAQSPYHNTYQSLSAVSCIAGDCSDKSIVEVIEGLICSLALAWQGERECEQGSAVDTGDGGDYKRTVAGTQPKLSTGALGFMLHTLMSVLYSLFLYIPLLLIHATTTACWKMASVATTTVYRMAYYAVSLMVWLIFLPFRLTERVAVYAWQILLSLAVRFLNMPVSSYPVGSTTTAAGHRHAIPAAINGHAIKH
mmetsp:Transcript_80594/g.158177  ORF Transcript_80594/g.158177 Transcript_80594/m.158177 type:complete len:484 (+) Transcript_80594:82-1533(+)